jgi:G3E family GTPase
LGRAVESIVQTILTSQINLIQDMLFKCNAANAKENLHKVSSPPNPNESGLENNSFPTPIKTNETPFLNQGKVNSSRSYDSRRNMDPEKTFEALAELGQLRQFSREPISGKKKLITKKDVETLLETKRQGQFCHTEKVYEDEISDSHSTTHFEYDNDIFGKDLGISRSYTKR